MSTLKNKNIQKPYTYFLKWKKENKWYYGVRYAKNCNTNDLWTTYFTSSKHVKEFVKIYGDPDIIKISKVFNTITEARIWENKILNKLNVLNRKDSLNKTNNISIDPIYCSIKSKGKSYEEIYGIEKAKILRMSRSISNKNYKRLPNGHSKETKIKMSIQRKGGKNSKSKPIVIKISNEKIYFSFLKECYDFLSKKFNITENSARFIIKSLINKKQICKRNNYKRIIEIYNIISITQL